MASARVRSHKASLLYDRLWKQTKAYGDEQYRKLNAHQDALYEQRGFSPLHPAFLQTGGKAIVALALDMW